MRNTSTSSAGMDCLDEPAVRSAFWSPAIEIGRDGIGVSEFPTPEYLTGWKMRAWALGNGTVGGVGSAKVVTAKNILVRLQAPRFFTERDEVGLSANVHNYPELKRRAVSVETARGDEACVARGTYSISSIGLMNLK